MEGYEVSSSGSEAETSAAADTAVTETAAGPDYENGGGTTGSNENFEFRGREEAVSSADDEKIMPAAADMTDEKRRDGNGEKDPSGEQRASVIQSAADLVPGNETEAVELARLQQEAVDFELQEYVRALNGGLAGVNAPMAAAAIENFKLTHNPQDLAAVKQFFPPQVVAAVSADSAVFNTQKAQSYDMSRRGRTLSGITKALFEFENSAGKGWFKEPWRGDVVAEAIRLAKDDISLPKVKKLLDAVEAGAVAKFKAQMKADAENRSQIARLQSPTGNYAGGQESSDDWHSIKDIETMNRKVLKFYEERNKCL